MKERRLAVWMWLGCVASMLAAGCGDDSTSSGAGGSGAAGSGGAATGGGGAGAGASTGGGPSTGGSNSGGGGGSSLLELGAACDVAGVCASGFCADGVCCDAACDGGCESCAATDTDGTDGTCAPVSAGTDPASECDDTGLCTTGMCDGNGACEARAQGTVCRDAVALCDAVEVCDGASFDCPSDALAAAGTVCHPSVGPCDIEDQCDGQQIDCPGNSVENNTVVCNDHYLCPGTSDMCPTTCASDDDCAVDNVCVAMACVPGRRVFITSTTTTGALGGLSGADASCQALADAANLRGTYRAWLSDTTGSPSTRFTQSTVPYIRVDGVAIASSYADLTDGALLAPLRINELGVAVTPNIPFTSTTPAGTAYQPSLNAAQDSCANWTSNSAGNHAQSGYSEGVDLGWTQLQQQPDVRQCNVLHRIYCFGQ